MASRIAYIHREEPPKTRPKKRGDYLAFLHQLPCVVTGSYEVQAAHVSYANSMHGHYGRAKGTKAPDRFALPLCADEHTRQHSMNEQAYWLSVGINPHELANTLWGLFCDYDEREAVARCTARINQGLALANRLRDRSADA